MVMRFLLYRTAPAAAVAVLLAGSTGCSSSKPNPLQDAPVTPDAPARLDATAPDAPGIPPGAALQIKTLSNRADMISGGDALLEISLPADTTAEHLHVVVGTRDVSSAFATRTNGRIIGVVTGLGDGANVVTGDLAGAHAGSLVINNHKIGGPVISGAQVTPFVCATPVATKGTGEVPDTNQSGLSTNAIDAQCNIATEVKLWYHATTPGCSNALPDPNPPIPAPAVPCFKPYDPATPPADLDTATVDGVTVPYVVRVERGTLNRGIYDIAVLFDPAKDDPATGWQPFAPQVGWNGKVVYTFGASSGQPRRQFRSEQSWTDNAALSRGFMVALNSMTDSLYNANRVSMSETVMMMKEKIIDTYGEVRYMLGNGCSGGSINQLTSASIFPGLLDGIQPTCTYPDAETTGVEIGDCVVLAHAYQTPAWKAIDTIAHATQDEINAKKAAINGHVDQTGCHAWINSFSNLGRPGNYVRTVVINNVTGEIGPDPLNPSVINNCQLPLSMVYHPVSNPSGIRCTGADHAVAIFGKVPGSNRARDTRDNVGVQYGLKAFMAGAITAEELVTLNEVVGGQDADLELTAARSKADPEALATAYRAGLVADAAHLAKTPIIDLRGYDDTNLSPPGPPGALGIHHVWRSFALRARLDAVNGSHGNHVMWRYGTGLVAPLASGLTLQSFLMMDQWVAAIKADASNTPIEQKITSHRPTEAFDFCFLGTDFSVKITDTVACNSDIHLKPHSSPRQVAGGPVAENVLKCQLKPINRADYAPVGLSDAQFDRLKAVFSDGVCDFTQPGVGQQAAVSPLDFSAGPGGVPFSAAPTSN